MSTDLVELALERFTDWARFESLAAEIVRDEGFPNVRVMGGVGDGGVDAIAERFYVNEGPITTVFQFSLQRDVASKVRSTVKRLRQAETAFQKLFLVTTTQISLDRQRDLKILARTELGVELDIIERKTVANRLSDPRLFARYFPDIGAQVASLARTLPGDPESREREQLKACLAFLFSSDAPHTRKAVCDTAVLQLLTREEASLAALRERVRAQLGGALLESDQISASLSRLAHRGLAKVLSGGASITDEGVTRLEAAGAAFDSADNSVLDELIATVASAAGTLSNGESAFLLENARALLAEYFRLNGIELCRILIEGVPAPVYLDATPRLSAIAGRRVQSHLGELLLASIAQALADPTPEQATFFARRARAYVALQVLNADPVLREFQATRFAQKMFLLDTDTVLTALLQHLPSSATYRALVTALIAKGAKVIIPQEVFEEVVRHLEMAPRTFLFFGASLNGMNRALVEERVWNALVRDYWYWTAARGAAATLSGFLRHRENYYDERAPAAFCRDAILTALPGISIKPLEELCGTTLPAERLQSAQATFDWLDRTGRSSQDRTPALRTALATVDSRLYRGLQELNAVGTGSTAILGRRAYIVSSSGRFSRAAARLNEEWAFSARPQILISLLDLSAPSGVSDVEYVRLFENPLLHKVVNDCWAQLHVLLRAGLDLRDKSLTRLRSDLDASLNDHLIRVAAADASADAATEAEASPKEEAAEVEYQALIKTARAAGYRGVPYLEVLAADSASAKVELARLNKENTELREHVEKSGRKHARWLRRLSRLESH